MTGKSVLYALAVAVLMGTMAVAALAGGQHGMGTYGPADRSVSSNVGASESHADAWDLREAMETGALPGQPVISSEAVCCRGIEEPATESGGTLFRPELDSGA